MGVYATVEIESGVDIPDFPGDPQEADWQSKIGVDPYNGPYRITDDGRLLRQQETRREKTDEEKREEAAEYGFDTWADYKEAVEAVDIFESMDNGWPPFVREQTVDEEWWGDHNQHGTVRFRTRHDGVRYAYEARFTKGDLDDIVLIDRSDRDT